MVEEQQSKTKSFKELYKRRVVEGYVHCNDKNENRTVILELLKNQDGMTRKKIIGCLRNLYINNKSYVIEEYLAKNGKIESRYIHGY